MGLTVHYGITANENLNGNAALELVKKMRQRALDLPFKGVSDLIVLKGDKCNYETYDNENPLKWLLIQARGMGGKKGYDVIPTELLAFEVDVADGSEPANIGLAIYPKTIMVLHPTLPRKKRIRTNLKGWRWGSFCKTQYASNSECGGPMNFLRAHVALITLLEYIGTLDGVSVRINDEGHYGPARYTDNWKVPNPVYTDHPATHDLKVLVKNVAEYNEMIAALCGKLKDEWGDKLIAPITDYPDFEHLEAKGAEKAAG